MMKRIWNEGTRGIGRIVAVVALGLALSAGALAARAESRVDLNAATIEELTSLPGIGPAKARAIVDRREEAPFESTDELTEVPGIGSALLEKLRDRVEVGETEDRQARRSKRPR